MDVSPDLLIQKYGILGLIVFQLIKFVWGLAQGNYRRYIVSIDQNTAAIKALEAKIDGIIPKMRLDLQTAFLNLKEVREQAKMGPITKLDQ